MGEGTDLFALSRSGKEIPVRVALNNIKSSKGDYVIANVRDITADIKLQKTRIEEEQIFSQQSKMAAMGEMVAAIAHQWKQPLNVLSGVFINIQDSFNHKSLTSHYMEQQIYIADNNLQYMASTINDFSDFLNPTSTADRFTLFNAFDVAKQITDYHLKDLGVKLNFVDFAEVIEIKGSKSEFTQVLITLINNAKEAIVSKKKQKQPAGTISIEPYITGGILIVDVVDDGCGISEDKIKHIFEPYFSTKQGQKNTGIGLYLTKTILNKKFDTTLEFVQDDELRTVFRLKIPKDKFFIKNA